MDHTVTTTVFATDSVIGFHRWPTAPEAVSYLRSRHRHKFGIRVEVSVVENDREVEFHLLRRGLESILWIGADIIEGTAEIDFGTRSCESMAHYIMDWLRQDFPGRDVYQVTVDEDGENGAVVTAAKWFTRETAEARS